MENLKKLLDTYGRYLVSLTNKETDVKKNFSAMKEIIERDAAPWLKKHMLQDALINTLRFNSEKYKEVEASSRIKLLMNASSDGTNLLTVVDRVANSLKADGTEGFSWLPTLYKYFRPENLNELNRMEMELGHMHKNSMVSDTHYQCVVQNVFNPRKTEFNLKETKAQAELEAALT